MPATASELALFRAELDIADAAMSDDVLNAIWDQAETDYEGHSRIVIRYAAYENALVYLLNRAARLVDYKANEADEKLSQLTANLAKLVAYYRQQKEQALQKDTLPAVAWGATKRKPPRRRDLPETW